MKRGELKTAVIYVLERNKTARANDNELIYQVLKRIGYPTDYEQLRKEETSNLASSITRERNKVVKANPLLQPAHHVVKRRLEIEKKMRALYGKKY